MSDFYDPKWCTPKSVAWSGEERALVEGWPYPVAYGFIERRRQDHPANFADLFGGLFGGGLA